GQVSVDERAVHVDARHVVRAELIVDEVRRALLQLQQRVRRQMFAVEEQDHDSTVGAIGRSRQDHVPPPFAPDLGLFGDEVEVLNRLRLALFEHFEVVRRQAGHEPALLVARDDVHLDERRRGLERRLLRRESGGGDGDEHDEHRFHGVTLAMNRSYLFLPAFCRNAIFEPSGDHAGRITSFVESTCCLCPASSITARRPDWFAYTIMPSACGDHPNVYPGRNCCPTNSPTFSPFTVSDTVFCVCCCARAAAASPAAVPPVPPGSSPPLARSPPIGEAVADSFCCPCFTSIANAFAPGACCPDFQAQYSVAHAGGASADFSAGSATERVK